jgi:hypothetical protein
VVYLTGHGRFIGAFIPAALKNVGLREAQFRRFADKLFKIEALLELKFGSVDAALLEVLRQTTDLDVLRQVQRAVKTAASPDELRRLLP